MKSESWLSKFLKIVRSDEPISIRDVLKSSFELYAKNFIFFLSFAVLAKIFELVNLLFHAQNMFHVRYWLLIAGSSVVGFFAVPALVTAVANTYESVPVTFKDAFKRTYGKYWKYLGYGLLLGIITGIGFLFFVLPGVYFGTIFSLVPAIVVIGKTKMMDPFHMSRELVKGSFIKVFLLGLISFVFVLVVRLLFSPTHDFFGKIVINPNIGIVLYTLITCISVPFWIAINVILYYKLERRKNSLIERGKAEFKFRGKFKNDKGEIVTSWFQAPNEDALKKYLLEIGWEILEIQLMEYSEKSEGPSQC